ncbi:hypothetical protein KEM52_000223 [Ascosphaera acerosa]|nr:hypothetical protein KEM52_000223 [Ascosphaera acerosa]
MAIQLPTALTSGLTERFGSLAAHPLASRFANLRPLSEFLDWRRVSRPHGFGEVQGRVAHNLAYFSSNYAVVFVLYGLYGLLTNLALLLVIALVAGGMLGIGKLDGRDLQLGFASLSTSQLYTALVCVAVPLGIWASPLSLALWLVGATSATVLGHAAFMDKPVENAFAEEAV